MDLSSRNSIILTGLFIFMIVVTIYSYGRYKGISIPYVCETTSESEHQHPEYYNSDEGMLTKVWGPPLWHVLHTISFNYKV